MRSCLWVQATPVQEYKNFSIDWTSKSSVWLKMWIWWLTEIGMLCSCSPASNLWGKGSFCAISIQEWAGGAVLGERSWEEKRLPSQDLGFGIGSCTFVTGANADLAWLLWVRTVWLLLFFFYFQSVRNQSDMVLMMKKCFFVFLISVSVGHGCLWNGIWQLQWYAATVSPV